MWNAKETILPGESLEYSLDVDVVKYKKPLESTVSEALKQGRGAEKLTVNLKPYFGFVLLGARDKTEIIFFYFFTYC